MNGILTIYIKFSISYGNEVSAQLSVADISDKRLVLSKNNPLGLLLLFACPSLFSDNKKPDQRPGKSHQYFINFQRQVPISRGYRRSYITP